MVESSGCEGLDPEALHGTFERVVDEAKESPPDDTSQIYRYRTGSGRISYVNDRERVPKAARSRAEPVDLTNISLNQVLARDIDAATTKELERLLSSDHCVQARAQADQPYLVHLWRTQGHLVAVFGVFLGFVILSPFLMRRLGVPRWTKLLLFLLPMLGLVAISGTAAVRMSAALSALKSAADPCRSETYEMSSNGHSTPSPRRKNALIDRLRQRIEASQTKRARSIDNLVLPPRPNPNEMRGLPQ